MVEIVTTGFLFALQEILNFSGIMEINLIFYLIDNVCMLLTYSITQIYIPKSIKRYHYQRVVILPAEFDIEFCVSSGGPVTEVQDECVVVGLLNKKVEIKKSAHSSLLL